MEWCGSVGKGACGWGKAEVEEVKVWWNGVGECECVCCVCVVV